MPDLKLAMQLKTSCRPCKGQCTHSTILSSKHNLIPPPSLFHPLSNPLLGLLILVPTSSVDEVPSLFVEVIHHLERGLLRTLSQEVLPSIAKVHGTET